MPEKEESERRRSLQQTERTEEGEGEGEERREPRVWTAGGFYKGERRADYFILF